MYMYVYIYIYIYSQKLLQKGWFERERRACQMDASLDGICTTSKNRYVETTSSQQPLMKVAVILLVM